MIEKKTAKTVGVQINKTKAIQREPERERERVIKIVFLTWFVILFLGHHDSFNNTIVSGVHTCNEIKPALEYQTNFWYHVIISVLNFKQKLHQNTSLICKLWKTCCHAFFY